jgi:predicted transcriptional regulator
MWITIAVDMYIGDGQMRTVQMTLDDELVREVDMVARRLRTTRSAFTRVALRRALTENAVQRLEQEHRQGYAKRPARKGEFDVWETEQAWGDE